MNVRLFSRPVAALAIALTIGTISAQTTFAGTGVDEQVSTITSVTQFTGTEATPTNKSYTPERTGRTTEDNSGTFTDGETYHTSDSPATRQTSSSG